MITLISFFYHKKLVLEKVEESAENLLCHQPKSYWNDFLCPLFTSNLFNFRVKFNIKLAAFMSTLKKK